MIDISSNQISQLTNLKHLEHLEEFWASSNQLSSFDEVEKELADKKELTTVYFEGNPLQTKSPALYRNKVRLALPQIKQIDASMSSFHAIAVLASFNNEHQYSHEYSFCPRSLDIDRRKDLVQALLSSNLSTMSSICRSTDPVGRLLVNLYESGVDALFLTFNLDVELGKV